MLFIDEIHRLSPRGGRSALFRDGGLRAGYHDRAKARTRALHARGSAASFTLVGATTRAGHAHRARCATALASSSGWNCTRRRSFPMIVQPQRAHSECEMRCGGRCWKSPAASRGTPRIANRLLRRVRDYAAGARRWHDHAAKSPVRAWVCWMWTSWGWTMSTARCCAR